MENMENMEQTILGILGDPDKMNQIAAMAQQLGLPAQIPRAMEKAEEIPISPPPPNHPGNARQQEALFQALIPYLRPNRRKKLKQALELANLSHVAEFAIEHYAKSRMDGEENV